MSDPFRRVHVPLIAIYLLMGIIGLLAVGILTWSISDHAAQSAADEVSKAQNEATSKIRVAAAQGCDRNQIQRAYLLLRSREVKSPTAVTAAGYFQIVDCNATYLRPNGEQTYLSTPLQDCFLKLVTDRAFGVHAENVTTDPARLHVEYNCT